MYFGNLSAVSERKARSASKKGGDDAETPATSAKTAAAPKAEKGPISSTTLAPAGTPLRYTSGSIPREVMLDYLNTCTAMMLTESNLRMVVDISRNTHMSLHSCLMEFQRQAMENNFAIEKGFGCQYMSNIPGHFPDDPVLHASAKRFMFVCMRAFLNALKLRKAEVLDVEARAKKGEGEKEKTEGEAEGAATGDPTPIPGRTSGGLRKEDVMEFFEGCNALMAMPETKRLLKDTFLATGQPPNAKVVSLQRSILALMGVDEDYGCRELAQVGERFGADQEVAMKMQQYMVAAEVAVREAAMTDEEKKKFYSQIPELMHHFPHMFVWQQRRMAQAQAMQQRQAQAGMGERGGHDHSHAHSHDHGAGAGAGSPQDEQAAWMGFINSAEGQRKLHALNNRIQVARSRVDGDLDVPSWSSERKVEFLEEFGGSETVRNIVSSGGGSSPASSIARIDSFLEMSPTELENVMVIQAIVQADQGSASGALKEHIAKLMGGGSGSFNMLPTPSLGTSSSGGGGRMHDHGHGHGQCNHDHSHDHGHSHGHSHGGHEEDAYMAGGSGGNIPSQFSSTASADVTRGKTETMDR